MSNQQPKTRQNAFLVAFKVKDGKLITATDVAPSEVVLNGGQPYGLRIFIPNSGEMFFPNDSIEKLVAYDKNDPTSVRYITIRKHMIFDGYVKYAKRLKDRLTQLEEETKLVQSLREALKKTLEEDPAIPDLKKLFEDAGGRI